MNRELYQYLHNFGRVKANEPLAKHTTFKIGGPAELILVVETTEKLVEALRYLDGEGISRFILGGGSNMLAGDEEHRGVFVKIKTTTTEILPDGLWADAGCSTVAIAQLSIQSGFTGFEWGVGVPGTIGGAVRGNAGAMGGEMNDSVASVLVYYNGEVSEYSAAECEFSYRDSIFKHQSAVILRVRLRLDKAGDVGGLKQAVQNLQYRNKTQPQGFASTGCIFQNVVPSKIGLTKEKLLALFPEDAEKIAKFFAIDRIAAGWLVEKAGLKGTQVGGAAVSDVHGNFIVNLGGATASDVEQLIEQIKEKVYDKLGVEIEEEIQIV